MPSRLRTAGEDSRKRDAKVLISESVFVHRAWAFWRSHGQSLCTHFYLRLRNNVVLVIGITEMMATSDNRKQETKKSILEYNLHTIFIL